VLPNVLFGHSSSVIIQEAKRSENREIWKPGNRKRKRIGSPETRMKKKLDQEIGKRIGMKNEEIRTIKNRRITRRFNPTALGRHALCLTGSIRGGLIAKGAPVTLRGCPSGQPLRPCSQVNRSLYGPKNKRSEIGIKRSERQIWTS